MKFYKTFKFRLYPDDEQKILIEKTFGCKRYVYNYFLEKCIKLDKSGKKTNAKELIKELTELKKEHEWLKEVDAMSLFTAIFNMHDAFIKQGDNYPKFKVKGVRESYQTNNVLNEFNGFSYETIRLDMKNHLLTLPKLKKMKIRGYRKLDKLDGKIKSATITKDAGKYYVSILVELPFTRIITTPTSAVGLDLGIKDFITTSYGEKINLEIKSYEKRLRGLQKGLARCKPGSKNRYKMKLKIQRLWAKIKNARRHFIFETTNKILKDNDIIAVETLDIRSMYKEHSIAKHLNKIPMRDLLNALKYKATWLGKIIVEVDKYYASSQKCNRCNYKNEKVKNLSVRNWECPKCGAIHDRDINASINIMFEGIRNYYGLKEIFV